VLLQSCRIGSDRCASEYRHPAAIFSPPSGFVARFAAACSLRRLQARAPPVARAHPVSGRTAYASDSLRRGSRCRRGPSLTIIESPLAYFSVNSRSDPPDSVSPSTVAHDECRKAASCVTGLCVAPHDWALASRSFDRRYVSPSPPHGSSCAKAVRTIRLTHPQLDGRRHSHSSKQSSRDTPPGLVSP